MLLQFFVRISLLKSISVRQSRRRTLAEAQRKIEAWRLLAPASLVIIPFAPLKAGSWLKELRRTNIEKHAYWKLVWVCVSVCLAVNYLTLKLEFSCD